MVIILLSFSLLFIQSVYSFNCSVSQIHIAQGLTPSSMTISWLTSDNCFSHVAYGLNINNMENIAHGSSSSYEFHHNKTNFTNYYKSGYIHHVLLTDLEPLTEYYYMCGDFIYEVTSKPLTFNTLPNTGSDKKITFAVLGDIGQTEYSLSTINHIMNEKNISMILHAGDLSYADCNQPLWDSYGNMIEPLASHIPWMVCPGNHEIEFNGTDYTNLFTAFETRYRMPYVKPAEFGDVIIKSEINPKTGQPYCTPSIFQTEYNFGNSFYSFDTGLAHIIYLNPYTNTDKTSQQFIWLENNLGSVDRTITPWIIVVMHCPWYSSNINHYADKQTVEMRSNMEYLFSKYQVNIVFNGHVHDYERTYPVFMNSTDYYGTVYVTIGNAGNLEGLDNKYVQQPKWSAFRNGTEYGYGTLTIINKKMLFWKWYINDGKQMVARDKVFLCNTYFGSSDCYDF
jgi:predicted phosphodiesterase